MGVLDIIYHMVNKSGVKKKSQKSKTRRKRNPTHNNKQTQQETVEKIEQKIVVKDLSNTEQLLKAWKNSVKNVSDHPLSQAKILNTQVLEQITDILTSMNSKLDRLELLDEVLELLKESRNEVLVVGGSTQKLDKAISRIETLNLTIKDEEVIHVLNDKGAQTADNLARVVGISRSTASSRLNRLEKMKVVRKKADGKLIYYSLHSKKND